MACKSIRTLQFSSHFYIKRLVQTVDLLEKKHGNMKEEKMDNMKEQLKLKSLERQLEMKDSEMTKLKLDNENLKKR